MEEKKDTIQNEDAPEPEQPKENKTETEDLKIKTYMINIKKKTSNQMMVKKKK